MCKFYQGAEDKLLEKALKSLFHKVHREKPESSRSVGSPCLPLDASVTLILYPGIEGGVFCWSEETSEGRQEGYL